MKRFGWLVRSMKKTKSQNFSLSHSVCHGLDCFPIVPHICRQKEHGHIHHNFTNFGSTTTKEMSSTPASMSSASSTSGEDQGFQLPVKRIKDEAKDLPFFQTSEAYARIMSYIQALNSSVLNKKVSDLLPPSEVTQANLFRQKHAKYSFKDTN